MGGLATLLSEEEEETTRTREANRSEEIKSTTVFKERDLLALAMFALLIT